MSLDNFESLLNGVNDILWSYILIVMLIGCAVLFTIRTRFVQFRMLGEMVRLLFAGPSSDTGKHPNGRRAATKDRDSRSKKHISSFQAFSVALASRIGTGNLAGVATAICIGGPGAVFWMWVIALLGSATAFVESTLAQLYKRKAKDAFIGGPAYYMKYGLGKAWMGVVFAVLMIMTFGLANSSLQSNTICAAWEKAFGIDTVYFGMILTLLTLFVAFGGIHRVAKVSSMIVPTMAVAYMVLSLAVLLWNISLLPAVLVTIVKSAFGMEQAAGGMIGLTIIQGVKRGLFSNEAGEGSAPNAAATADVSHPVKQGLIQALGVFTDTLIVCSCTAFIILLSGVDYTAVNGVQLTQEALTSEIGSIGNPFIALMILLFAFSTVIGNYYYGEANVRYITKSRIALFVYRITAGAVVMIGSVITLNLAWSITDVMMALLTACNLIAITPLSGQVLRLLKDYRRQRHQGRDPVFRRSQMPDISEKLDAWE